MDLQPLPTEQTLSPFDIMSCEIKRSQFSSRSFQNNGSSIAIPVYGFNSFEQEESDGIDNVASYNDLNELSKDCTLSSSTLPPYDTMDSLYTDNTMDPSDDYNPSDGIHLFQSYFPVDESESFLLRDDSTSNLSFPCFQQGLSDTPDANCDISGTESSVDSTIIRTRNDSIDSNGIVSDALLSDINPIGIHDLQLISSSFSPCVLPVCQPLKRIHTVCGDMAKSRMGFLTKKDKRSRLSSAMKPIRHDCRFGDVYQCSSDRDCFFVFSKRHMDYLRSGHSRFSTI